MNWCEVQNEWHQQKIVLQCHWPRLTDEDLIVINGDRGELARILQSRYDLIDGAVEKYISDFERDVRRPGAVK